jgi:hypothetical protein
MVAMSLTLIMGVLGLVVDIGWSRFIQQSQQAAADAGVMAATYQAKVNNANVSNFCSSVTANSCTTTFTACPVAATDSLYSACQYASANIFDPRATIKVVEGVNSVPWSGGATSAYWAEVLVTQKVNQLFSWVGGHQAATASATATAVIIKSAKSTSCVTIDDPNNDDFWGSGTGSLFATGTGANLVAGCGIAVANYGADAISVNGLATITGGDVTTCGGENVNTGSIKAGSGDTNTYGSDKSGCAGFSDPNAGLALPSVGGVVASAKLGTGPACGSFPNGQTAQTTFDSNTNYTTGKNGGSNSAAHPIVLNPGVYCGGLAIQGAAVVFNPGVYVMNGGQFYIHNSSTVTNGTDTNGGDIGGVMFYLTAYSGQSYKGFSMGDSNIVNVDLTAPTTGTYDGILIYQDPGVETKPTGPNDPSTSTLDAHGAVTLAGQVYLPTTALLVTGQPTTLGVTGLDVYALEFNGSASLTMAAAANGGGGTIYGPPIMTN